jgi:hypothetical protein
MFAFVRAILILAKSLKRIAVVLEKIHALYELELRYQGIVQITPGIVDEVEVSYGTKNLNSYDG